MNHLPPRQEMIEMPTSPAQDHGSLASVDNNGRVALAARIALRYVSVGRRSQLVSFMSMLTIGGLALSVTILVTVLSVMNGFDREVRENVLGVLPHASVISRERPRTGVWQALEAQLLQLPELIGTAPVLEVTGVIAGPGGSKGVLVTGIEPQREAAISSLDRFMRQGSLRALDEERFQLVLGETLAQRMGVSLGDSVTLYSLNVSVNPIAPLPVQRRFTVAGIYRVGTQELDEELVIIRLADAQALYRQPDSFNALRLRTNDVLAVNNLRTRLEPLLPAGYRLETWTQWFGAIYENIRLSRTIVGFLLWLLVAVAAFNLVVSLVMIVRDKRGDIAILRTMGASPGMIGRIFVIQGCLIGLVGTAAGLLLGSILALTVSDIFAWIETLSGAQLLSADVYPVDFLPSELRLADLLTVSGGVLILSLAASLYPAWRASRVHPAEALRSE